MGIPYLKRLLCRARDGPTCKNGGMKDAVFEYGLDRESLDSKRLESFLARLETDRASALDGVRTDFGGFLERLEERYGKGFGELLLIHNMTLECANASIAACTHAQNAALEEGGSDDDLEAWVDYANVLAGLVTRAALAFCEMSWLLSGGFPRGAWLRVRTLHELYVTALALALHGHPGGEHPELVTRYLLHRYVFLGSTADELLEVGSPGMGDILNEDVLDSLERHREELLSRFGKSYKTQWGWVAPLFAEGENPSFKTLAEKVGARSIQYFYGLASSNVHASSEGLEDGFVQRGEDWLPLSGPTNVGLLFPATVGCALLRGLLEAAIPVRVSGGSFADDRGGYFLAGIDAACDRALDALAQGEERVAREEAEFQGRAPAERGAQ